MADAGRGRIAGGAASAGARWTWGVLLASPGLAWLTVFVVLPTLGLAAVMFMGRTADGQIDPSFTLRNLRRMAGFGSFGFAWDNARIVVRTLVVSGLSSAGAIAVALPMALWIARRSRGRQYALLALVGVPMCTNLVVRTQAWMHLLGPGSVLAEAWDGARRLAGVGEAGASAGSASLYPSIGAVLAGMISIGIPLAVLPIYAAAERMDRSLLDAARDLYATRWGVWRHAMYPQIRPGIGAAVVLTFVPALGMFVVPDLLGGAKHWMLGNLIQQQFGSSRDWAYGATLCLALAGVTLGVLVIGAGGRRGRGGRGRREERGDSAEAGE